MRFGPVVAAGLACLLLAGAAAAQGPAEPHPLSTVDHAAINHAIARGRLIYAYDQAAWVATDELLRQIPDPKDAGISGWVVESRPQGLRVVFLRRSGPKPTAAFTVDVNGRAIVATHRLEPGEDATLSEADLAMVAALDVAVRQPLARCVDEPFNAVVLPPSPDDGVVPVYILTPQVKAAEYPVGRHYELDVAKDGRIVSQRAFTKSCLAMSSPPDSVGLMVPHFLDRTPTEIHVWLSLWARKPVYVATGPDVLWVVQGDKIEPVSKPAGRPS